MASIKIKFRPSAVYGKEGTVYYQVLHNRVPRQIRTDYRIFESEWNPSLSEIITLCADKERKIYLTGIWSNIQMDIQRIQKIIISLNHKREAYHSDDVVSAFTSQDSHISLFGFMEDIISSLKKQGKVRTSETYLATLNSFRSFRKGKDITFDKFDSDVASAYESYLKKRGVCPNSSSFYMRNLRAVYNRAVDKGITVQRLPFKNVYTGVDKTVKRAVTLKIIRKIKDLDLSLNPVLDFARDMFLFSFYTRGMSLVDMAYLRKKDLANGILSYRRHKTGQQLFIKWEACMQNIVDKYDMPDSIRLLPLITQPNINERKQYIYAGQRVNRSLKVIAKELGLSINLTMYVARHSWASIAKNKNVPLSVISEGMGHDSETTTRIYLASLDNMVIDKANSLILKSL